MDPEPAAAAAAAAPPADYQLSDKDLALEARLRDNPNNADTWEDLISRLHLVPIERARNVMDRVVERYPMSGWVWVRYAEVEEAAKNDDRVRDLLARSLYSCFSVDVWTFYLAWLSRTCRGEKARATIMEAFEEAVKPQNIGCAMDASSVWRNYLDFLLSEPEETQYEKTQKAQLLRKAYQRAVQLPIRNVDALWREYTLFEQKQSASGAKKMVEDEQPKYTHASEVLKERETFWRAVLPPTGSKPSNRLPRPFGKTPAEVSRAQAWAAVLRYERTNPERLDMIDLKLRVRLSFRHALQDLYFYPEVWYGFADFERSVSDTEASLTIFRAGLHALPDSALLCLSVADALEADGNRDEARRAHEAHVAATRSSLAFCQHMRFARRQDGVAAARAVFKAAREADSCDPQVFCVAAMLELYANKSPATCRNVFELGLKKFPGDVFLLNAYLDAVEVMNDDSAIRDVFERAVEALGTSDDALRVWERYRAFLRDRCAGGGDLTALALCEQRMAEAFKTRPELTGLAGAVHRYALFGALPQGSADDAGFFERFDVGRAVARQASRSASAHVPAISSTSSRSHPAAPITTAPKSVAAETTAEDLESVPPFLRKLVALLPRKSAIASMDADFVLRSLAKGSLPPPPVVRAFEDELSRKRKHDDAILGSQGAPVDAFKQRQATKKSRS